MTRSQLSAQEVAEIAELARLHLEPAEVESVCGDLAAILDHFANLAEVDTTNVPPMTHASHGIALRDDRVAPSLPVAEALRGVPHRDGDAIVVPAAIPEAQR